MLYSKRRKNLGGGLRKRSNRKSYRKNRSNTLRIQGGRPEFWWAHKFLNTEKYKQKQQKKAEKLKKEAEKLKKEETEKLKKAIESFENEYDIAVHNGNWVNPEVLPGAKLLTSDQKEDIMDRINLRYPK